MIDGRRFDLAGAGRGSEQKEREAVRTAGDCNADARVRRNQRVEIVSKTLQQGGLGNHPGGISTSAALRLRLGVGFLLLEVRPDLGSVDASSSA